MVVVGALNSPKLLQHIQFFVREVERIKALAYPQDTGATEANGEREFEIEDLGEEFAGTKTYTITRTIDAGCDHGIVVNGLRRKLQKLGYAIGKDRFRDLYVHRGKRATSLFEIKPDTSTTSIYAAVGQLLIHSDGQSAPSTLIFVAPEALSVKVRKKLKKIGIDFLGYRWVDGEPEFPGLEGWKF